jgi:hypothetical protein
VARILRGEIRWADLNRTVGHERGGRRPVLILSQDIFNERSGIVIAVAVTSQPQRAHDAFRRAQFLSPDLAVQARDPLSMLFMPAYEEMFPRRRSGNGKRVDDS